MARCAGIAFLRSFGDRTPYADAAGHRRARATRSRSGSCATRSSCRRASTGTATWTSSSTRAPRARSSRGASRSASASRRLITTLSAGVGDIGLRGAPARPARLARDRVAQGPERAVLIKNPPLAEMPAREAEAFSPLALGLSMSVDYRPQAADDRARRARSARPTSRLPLCLHRLATVRGVVDGAHAANFVVDTGGEVISISAATARSLTKIRRPAPHSAQGLRHVGMGPATPTCCRASTWRSSEIAFRNMPVVVLEPRGAERAARLPDRRHRRAQFLSKYRVDIDLDRSVLRLKRIS